MAVQANTGQKGVLDEGKKGFSVSGQNVVKDIWEQTLAKVREDLGISPKEKELEQGGDPGLCRLKIREVSQYRVQAGYQGWCNMESRRFQEKGGISQLGYMVGKKKT